jgi:hypothetical protein
MLLRINLGNTLEHDENTKIHFINGTSVACAMNPIVKRII